MTERFQVFVEGYHWMMEGCLLSLILYFSEMQSFDFFEHKRKKIQLQGRKTANLAFKTDLVKQHYFASSTCFKAVFL